VRRGRLAASRSPPRCDDDLQRLTDRRSRSFGFPTPPASLRLATWTLASSADPPAGRVTARPWIPLMAFHSPSRTSPAYLPTIRPCSRFARPFGWLSSHEVRRPSDAPNTGNPLPGGTRSRNRSSARSLHLVAGFQARFGPPTPSLTTVTVCASQCPVVCFDHSHPWGSASPLPGPDRLGPKAAPPVSKGLATTREPPGRCLPSRHRGDAPSRTAAPLQKGTVRLRLPSTSVMNCVRRLPATHPKMNRQPSLGRVAARLPGRPPRPLHRNETATTRWT
jgi:hypothetical protein